MNNDLKFSGVNPVVINYNGSVDDIYAPVKTSSCDVNIISNKILDDLYTAKKDGIFVQVNRKTPKIRYEIEYLDHGSASSFDIEYSELNNFLIGQYRNFFKDVYGNFLFSGTIQRNSVEETAFLRYDTSNNVWIQSNHWKLSLGQEYFYDSPNNYYNSFCVYYDSVDDHYYKKVWSGDNWGEPSIYYMSEDGVDVECNYPTSNIVHYLDETIELIHGTKRYSWDSLNFKWLRTSRYAPATNFSYSGMDGQWYHSVLNDGQLVDAIIITGVSGAPNDVESWIVKLNKSMNTVSLMIPLSVGNGSPDRVFTDSNGNVYYVTPDFEIWYWIPAASTWVKWITFNDDYLQEDSLVLDYVLDIANKSMLLNYNTNKFFTLSDLVPPTVNVNPVIIPGQFDVTTVWEGYKMPNTFSQDVTLNLDEISMTCIDPVSILKYVKIDKLFKKPNIMLYRDIIGTSLAYVMLNSNTLKVERNITYGSATHSSTNNILNMMCQISNFWDEGNDPCTIYEVIEELLRPFCLTLQYVDNCYWIFNQTRTSDDSVYDEYTIEPSGELTFVDNRVIEPITYDMSDNDWKSNNTETASIEIGSTFSKVTAVASTSIPQFSDMVFDKVDYSNRDKYDIFQFNVNRNKTKGYRKMSTGSSVVPTLRLDDTDYWFYLWNGVYLDENYELYSFDQLVNGYLNINKGYEYRWAVSGNPVTTDPWDYGSILNFYGGANNPTAAGRGQTSEKPVEIKKRITAYSEDNGYPPEFLEESDLVWSYDSNYDEEGNIYQPVLSKDDGLTNNRFGADWQPSGTHRVVYKQKYENVSINSLNAQTIDIRLTQSYSRTGIDVPINIINNNTSTNNYFLLRYPDEPSAYYKPDILSSNVKYFPYWWNSEAVKVNSDYFNRYSTNRHNGRITPVWDRRRIDIYVDLGDSVLQFNGKEWVEDTAFNESNSFYLLKLMNYQPLFHTDYSYNVIETSDYDSEHPDDGGHYSLTDENWGYNIDSHGGVVENASSNNKFCPPYKSETNEWSQWINDCGEGYLSIILPTIDASIVDVIVNITSSSLLGSTGGSTIDHDYHDLRVWMYYPYTGTGKMKDPDTGLYYDVPLSPQNIGPLYGTIGSVQDIVPSLGGPLIDFLPPNVSFVKAEHLDLSISMKTPESNLGQMFSQSDIKYIIDQNNNYDEEYQISSFKENTYNSLVNSSFSYILYDGNIAQPDEFVINNLGVRPECYTVQAYMNWLSKIRKSYKKTLIPLKNATRPFNNFKNFIKSPEVGSNKLMVVSDSWDLKSNRHSISSIESQDLDVTTVQSYNVLELPRKARNERWNLPTANKK